MDYDILWNEEDLLELEALNEIFNLQEVKKMNYVTKYRIRKLKAMHEMVLNIDDENYYMTWIYTVPDEPSDNDFEDIAENIEMYNEVETLFKKLIVKAIKNDEFQEV